MPRAAVFAFELCLNKFSTVPVLNNFNVLTDWLAG
jgi:hypothetical protein